MDKRFSIERLSVPSGAFGSTCLHKEIKQMKSLMNPEENNNSNNPPPFYQIQKRHHSNQNTLAKKILIKYVDGIKKDFNRIVFKEEKMERQLSKIGTNLTGKPSKYVLCKSRKPKKPNNSYFY